MKTYLLTILLIFCFTQVFHSQEDDGVVSLVLPIRNSLTFNRFALNPTFSFVREQSKAISVYNKREWVEFDDAPLTYLASYSGRFSENIGAGLGLFQQNYGVLTTFGGILNFAYNARLGRENNLTFALNAGAYKSGLNASKVITNFSDPSTQNVPENFLLTVNPGINFGTEFFDFGVSVNNLVLYNLETSNMVEDNPSQSIQGHIMYTGYMASNGFFDESKFSGLIKSEFSRDNTIISAIAMLTVPKGIWTQVGYNTQFGVSGGLGINITNQIALEYNYEKAIGDFSNFGSSHDFTLAYRFTNKYRFKYGSEDEVVGILSNGIKRRKSKPISRAKAEENKRIIAERRAKAQIERADREERLAQKRADEKALREADTKSSNVQESNNDEENQAQQIAEQKAKKEAEAQARLLAEQKAKEEAEAQAKLLAEKKVKEEAEAQAKLLEEQKAKEEAEAQARLLEEQKAMAEAKAQAKLLADEQTKLESEAQARLLEEQK
ncbi:MAG: PorP/SprF family type IX secretion system membrane protein, partial [Winogradskyella sp.]|uniref:PorP/SprF family type IX secretion system membrane protein n=1 Tax=Winogradskyella sp. TaxID=1883156 RepID=UPI00179EFF9B|nr:PorP/SprF family type IX secretion system membrane protein [Winogradskyella sp.]